MKLTLEMIGNLSKTILLYIILKDDKMIGKNLSFILKIFLIISWNIGLI